MHVDRRVPRSATPAPPADVEAGHVLEIGNSGTAWLVPRIRSIASNRRTRCSTWTGSARSCFVVLVGQLARFLAADDPGHRLGDVQAPRALDPDGPDRHLARRHRSRFRSLRWSSPILPRGPSQLRTRILIVWSSATCSSTIVISPLLQLADQPVIDVLLGHAADQRPRRSLELGLGLAAPFHAKLERAAGVAAEDGPDPVALDDHLLAGRPRAGRGSRCLRPRSRPGSYGVGDLARLAGPAFWATAKPSVPTAAEMAAAIRSARPR